MSRRLLFRSSAGIDHYMIEDGNETRFEAVAPTDPIIEHNKKLVTHNDGYTADRSIRRVASIPYIVMLHWLYSEGWWALDPECADKLAAKLNSSEYAHLRTAEGQLAVSNGELR
jgi:hypothetical protein